MCYWWCECKAEWVCRDPEQAFERSIHFQNEKQGAANRYGAQEEKPDDR